MSPSPLPPHEREWRHPSELGPPAHEPTTSGGRLLIVSTATFGLLLVGLLALTMTPGRTDAPQAVGSTVTLPPPRVQSTRAAATQGTTDDLGGSVGPGDATAAPTTQRPAATTTVAIGLRALPLVTPVGDDGFAITSSESVGVASTLQARLPSGQIVQAEVVRNDGRDIAVVVLTDSIHPTGMQVSEVVSFAPSDTVAVHVLGRGEPMVVTLEELAVLTVDEGTPVTDGDGNLIGICTQQDEPDAATTSLTRVGPLPEIEPTPVAESTTSPPAPASATVPDTAPPTTEPPAPPTSGPEVSAPSVSTDE